MFTIGERFAIVAPEEVPVETGERIPITISKGAFGSGEHETTASCLDVLARLEDIEDRAVLDLGSGTGILTFGALKLGAKEAVCVDISPDAVRTCRRNAELNGLQDRIRHVTGTIEAVRGEAFDLVLANIYGDLLLDLAPDLVAGCRPGGHLLLSGMLWEYHSDVRRTYEQLGCTLLERKMLPEFCTQLFRREAS
ncbi:MAG: 50S ribosomal protein L11 methyltransferase [Geothermobacteraceae bacterium]